MSDHSFNRYSGWFSIAFLLGAAFSPNIKITSSTPSIRAEDVVAVVGVLYLIFNGKGLPRLYGSFQWGVIYLFVVAGISLAINGNLFNFSDLIELYKYAKLLVVSVFAYHGARYVFSYLRFSGPFVIALVVLNVIQYFGLFSFNDALASLYASPDQLAGFIESSPQSKRLLGLMGNPNVNAAFWFLSVVLLMSSNVRFKAVYVILCALMIVASQSRGMLVGAVCAAIIYFLRARMTAKKRFWVVCSVIAMMYVLFFHAAPYLNYIAVGMQANVVEDGSFTERIDVWTRLWDLALDRPMFGYGGAKQFFYDNAIYPDNEYILYLFRWGIAGLIGYCMLYWDGIISIFRSDHRSYCIGVSSVGLICAAIFNVPLTDPHISVLFSLLMGLLLYTRREYGKRRVIAAAPDRRHIGRHLFTPGAV
jgi:O-antigen ligase